jgi:hypothetical protein
MNNYNNPSWHPRYTPPQPQDDQTPSQDYMDRQLTNKARRFRYPATPDIASAASQRLAADRAHRAFRESAKVFRPRKHPSLAVACVLAVVLMALAVPQVRTFVGSVSMGAWRFVQHDPEPANVPAVPTLTPVHHWDPHLVGETDLGTAIATMGMSVLLPTYPAGIGLPDHVYYQRDLTSVMIFVWMDPDRPDTPSMALYKFPITVSGSRIVPSDSTVVTQTQQVVNDSLVTQPLKVGTTKAKWIEGQYLFELGYQDDKGSVTKRMGEVMDGNTLVWEPDASNYGYKLVTYASVDEALLIADSLKPLSPPPTPYPTSLPTSPSSGLDIAGEISFYELDRTDGFKVKVPTIISMPELIAPSRLYLQTGAGMGKTVVMAWYFPGRTDSLRMVMMQGTWDDSIDTLDANATGLAQTSTVHGNTAQWVEGPQYMYVNTAGGATELSSRGWLQNSRTLVWQENGLKYRLETELSLEDAVQVAESLR